MPNRTTTTHRFQVQELTHRPVAVVTPAEATGIIGSSVVLAATGSTVNGVYETGMTFEWTVNAPDGSNVDSVLYEEEDGSKVRLDGDVTGTYAVSLTVTYNGVSSEAVVAGVFFSPVIVPAIKRLPPDGRFMFSVLSDFWKMVNDRDVFPVVWSSYTQTVASDLLRALQIDRSKSIATVQSLFQKRFIEISPEMEIDHTQVNMIFGNHQSGNSAFTGDVTFVDSGALVSSKEFLLLSTASSSAVGTSLTIFSGDNTGSYLINRLNAAGNGFIISEASPFPDYSSTIRISGSDLVTTSSTTVYSVTTDLAAAGAEAGDFLRIKEGASSGFYKISAVGTAGGLASDRHLQLDTSLDASSNLKFDVFQSIRVSYLKEGEAFTDTIYIPKDDVDLEVYDVGALTSNDGEVVSDYEILVNPKHLIDSAIDKRITLTTGTISGSSFTVSGFNESRTGFIVTEPMAVAAFPETVSYSIDIGTSVADRLLVLEGKGHDVASYSLLEGLPSVAEGGRGDLWVITLAEPTAPSRREGLEWRIGSTIESEIVDDFSAYGVSSGDQLILEVERVDLQKSSFLHCTVTGAHKNQVSFELGTVELDSRTSGVVDPKDAEKIGVDLSIPTVSVSEVTGDPVYTSSALEIYSYLVGSSFSNSFFNYPLDAETEINIDDFFNVRIKPRAIIRNSAIGLDPEDEFEDSPIFSIPALHEYLSPEQVSEAEDGSYTVVSQDGVVKTLDRKPVVLVENVNYKISAGKITGAGASCIAGAATITFADLDCFANDIRVGDRVEILSGLSQGTYAISGIPTATSIRVGGRESDSSLPVSTESSVDYQITRQDSGVFLRFTEAFSVANPAPKRLWAPVVLVDNFKYIEDNFGVLVGLTKNQLTEYGTTQIAYKSAVAGLMYSWAKGPTFRSAEVGAHILLDGPVTEALGEIIEINADYTGNKGRVVVEDLTPDGEAGTGIYRTYLYPNYSDFNIERFKGLGTNPHTGEQFAVGDTVLPFTPLSNSVTISDRVSEPGWWRKYGEVAGAAELEKYHTWQAEFDLKTVDSRDIPLASDFLMKIRPIYTKPKIVGVIALQDTVYVETSLFVDLDVFFFDDPAFSRESTHMVDSYNDSGASTRLLDYGSFASRTLFRGHDLVMEDNSNVVTSARGGFISGTTNTDGDQVLPGVNTYFDAEVKIRGEAFVRPGDILYITSGRNRDRFVVTSVTSDTELVVEQYAESVPRGIDPTTHMRADTNGVFHIQRFESDLITSGTSISASASNVITVSGATFWSNGVTADDVLVITTGNNRGVYSIQDLGEYNGVSEVFDEEETKLTLRTALPDAADLSHAFEIRRRVLIQNPSFSATDGVTTAAASYISTASHPDLQFIVRGDFLIPSSGTDASVVFRVVGVSGDTIHTDIPFTDSDTGVSFDVSHASFVSDESDSDYRLERLNPYDRVDLTIYEPIVLIHSGVFTLTDNGVAASPVCQATNEAGTDLTALATPVQAGDKLEVAVVSSDSDGDGTDDTTSSSSHGFYDIASVSGATAVVESFFPGVVLSSASLLDPSDPAYSAAVVPETGVSVNIYTKSANFSVTGTSVGMVSLITGTVTGPSGNPPVQDFEDMGVAPGDFFESSDGTEYLIIEVSGSTLTLAEDTGATTSMSGRIFRREYP